MYKRRGGKAAGIQQVNTRQRHRLSSELRHFTLGDWSSSETNGGQ
jgi:hypothetical protein